MRTRDAAHSHVESTAFKPPKNERENANIFIAEGAANWDANAQTELHEDKYAILCSSNNYYCSKYSVLSSEEFVTLSIVGIQK